MIYLCFLEELLVKNRVLAVFPRLAPEWIVSFTIRLTSVTASKGFCNIFHMTQNGNMEEYGDRTPAVLLKREKDGSTYTEFLINSGINGLTSYVQARPPVPEINFLTRIEIHQRYESQDKYRVFVKINGEEIQHSTINTDARLFNKVKVYISDPWFDTCSGYIKNLVITNFT